MPTLFVSLSSSNFQTQSDQECLKAMVPIQLPQFNKQLLFASFFASISYTGEKPSRYSISSFVSLYTVVVAVYNNSAPL